MARSFKKLVDSDFASQNHEAQTKILRLFDRKLHKIQEAGYDEETQQNKTGALCRWLAIKSKSLQKFFMSERDATIRMASN